MLIWIALIICCIVGMFFIITSQPAQETPVETSFAGAFESIWSDLIYEKIPVTRKMPPALKKKYYSDISTFMTEKTFVGENGIDVTDEMKVVIAAQACILLLGRDGPIYPMLDQIHMFSEQFLPHHFAGQNAVLDLDHAHVIGLSWHDGPMALAWDHAVEDALKARDGHNVVFHEFAHQLDRESGLINGVPIMGDAVTFNTWITVMRREFEALKQAQKSGKPSVINEYGASGLEEFFAVVTELFFENPEALLSGHNDLYQQFQLFYNVDPAGWKLKRRPKR